MLWRTAAVSGRTLEGLSVPLELSVSHTVVLAQTRTLFRVERRTLRLFGLEEAREQSVNVRPLSELLTLTSAASLVAAVEALSPGAHSAQYLAAWLRAAERAALSEELRDTLRDVFLCLISFEAQYLLG
jgi:hypothetical protein